MPNTRYELSDTVVVRLAGVTKKVDPHIVSEGKSEEQLVETASNCFVIFEGETPVARILGGEVRARDDIQDWLSHDEIVGLPIWETTCWHHNSEQRWTPIPVTEDELGLITSYRPSCLDDHDAPSRATLLKELQRCA